MPREANAKPIGKRLSQWRRLLLALGPPAAKKVGLAIAEFAWADQDDVDADLLARHCTHRILTQLCDLKKRGLLTQIRALELSGWIARDSERLGPGVHRQYVLTVPDCIPQDAIDATRSPGAGMWKRVLQANTERAGATECTRSDGDGERNDGQRVQPDARTGALERTNGCTPAHERVQPDAPYKESSSSYVSSSLVGAAPTAPKTALKKPSKPKAKRKNTTGLNPIAGVIDSLGIANQGKEVSTVKTPEPELIAKLEPISEFKLTAIRTLLAQGKAPAAIAKLAGLSEAQVREAIA